MDCMKIAKIMISELVLVVASVFIFRSLWTLLDQYFGNAYLVEMLVLGVLLTIISLILINECMQPDGKGSADKK
mgnify:CR=1 FL=1